MLIDYMLVYTDLSQDNLTEIHVVMVCHGMLIVYWWYVDGIM